MRLTWSRLFPETKIQTKGEKRRSQVGIMMPEQENTDE